MILHVDMDAFYASVEERDRPELVGQPLIVGGTPDRRGVVAAANYVVRRFGVHSAMTTSTALKLCPQAIVLPVRMSYYAGISEQIREIFFRYTPLVEPLSLDEAFLDVSGSVQLFGNAQEIARRIKQEIWNETQLVASVGVAPNKFLAKIASDLKKPDALVVVEPDQVQAFLDPLPISRLWGVGEATLKEFQRIGVQTIGDIRRLNREQLTQQFGQPGDRFWNLAHGRDDRKVVPDREAKSISHETTFPTNLHDPEILLSWLQDLTAQVARRLRRSGLKGKTVQLKLRFADFHTITRSQTLAQTTDNTDDLWLSASALLRQSLPETHRGIRLLGMGVSSLEARQQLRQLDLFEDEEHQKKERLDVVTDQLQDKFGAGILMRGSGLLRRASEKPEQ
ncbi:DNA polymerase IV [Planctomicrobium sp. SH661]|uniref:DNA polymerase IV n=1 Tax=Planctomicrobium sp. SH661 TaxID=3448124 RepID=UPI003F5C1B10